MHVVSTSFWRCKFTTFREVGKRDTAPGEYANATLSNLTPCKAYVNAHNNNEYLYSALSLKSS